MMVLCCWFLLILMVCLFIMLKSTHPILFMACIALVSLMMSLLISVYSNVVLGALVILIYVGGVMVPFSYSVCLAPNPDFVGSSKPKGLLYFVISGAVFSFFFILYFLSFFYFFSDSTFFTDFSLSKDFQYDSSIFFSEGWGKMILELSAVLIVLLVSVVSFSGCSKGALVPVDFSH
uniref:NADH dehydrogenase subunit 6 n=1 Tax=Sinonovacula constricta TaxID=98310 RepID=I6NJD1_SINCO|nr:NADH dehydrogenase subunit 6 [Sinonovacula constricta]